MTATLGVFSAVFDSSIDSLQSLFNIEICDRCDNVPLLLFIEFRIDWKRYDFRARGLRHGKISLPMSQIGKGFLQMQWFRIVDLRRDAPALQVFTQRVSLFDPDGELVVDVSKTPRCDGAGHHGVQAKLVEQFAIAIGVPSPRAGPAVKVAQLDSQNRRLQCI